MQTKIAYKLFKPAAQGEEQKTEDKDLYVRFVVTNPKTRIKNLKQLILEDLGMKDTCAIRLYSEVGEPVVKDMDLLKELSLEKV